MPLPLVCCILCPANAIQWGPGVVPELVLGMADTLSVVMGYVGLYHLVVGVSVQVVCGD